jgi:photosystem II stability/assembly factor-like uncharacterized protein
MSLLLSQFYPESGIEIENVVYTTGDQFISGTKNFYDRPQYLNSGLLTFGDFTENELLITGFFSGSFDSFTLSDNLFYVSQASGQITGIGYTGHYDGGIFLGRTKLSQNNTQLINIGKTWKVKESNRNWRSIAVSSDGKYQTAVVSNGGKIYISSDYGNTWEPKESNRNWRSIAISSDGKYQTAVVFEGPAYISSDYGNTWTLKESDSSLLHVAISSDGKYQTIVGVGIISISSDYGQTWRPSAPILSTWQSIAISSDGKYQTVVETGLSPGQIYISSDYGNTWELINITSYWNSITMSSDGKYQTIVGSSIQPIYISSDYGKTWNPKESDNPLLSTFGYGVAMSSDGKYQIVISFNKAIHISYDYGNTWNQVGTNLGLNNWTSVAMSSDGKYQVVTVGNGQIYISIADELIHGNFTADNIYGNNLLYNTGNQTVDGVKDFTARPTVNGIGVLLQNESAGGIVENVVYTTGNQTVDGVKDFISRPTFSGLDLITTGDLVNLELNIEGSLISSNFFNGDRPITRIPILGTNYGGTTISGFLNNLFFPYIESNVTLNSFTTKRYGIDSVNLDIFAGTINLNSDIITGIGYMSGNNVQLGPLSRTVGGNYSSFPLTVNVGGTVISSTNENYKTRIYITRSGTPLTVDSNVQRLRFEPVYYWGVSNNPNLTDVSLLTRVDPVSNSNFYNYNYGSRPGSITHGFIPNNQYIYLIYPSFARDGIIDWGTVTEIRDMNTNLTYTLNTYQTGQLILNLTHQTNMRYRVYRSVDLITPVDPLNPPTYNFRFTLGGTT